MRFPRAPCTSVIRPDFFVADSVDHTANHLSCPACAAANAALQAEKVNIAAMPFHTARKFWKLLLAQSATLRPGTHSRNEEYLNSLEIFFGAIRLNEIAHGANPNQPNQAKRRLST